MLDKLVAFQNTGRFSDEEIVVTTVMEPGRATPLLSTLPNQPAGPGP